MAEDKRPLSFTARLSNLWYYYKWFILLGLVAVILLGTAMCQMIAKKSPDAMIMYAGPAAIPAESYQTFDRTLAEIMREDYNGDGYKVVDFMENTFLMYEPEGQNQNVVYNVTGQSETQKRFQIEIAMGSSVIYILDETLYQTIKDVLLPLKDALGYQPQGAIDDYGIRLNSLAAYQKTAVCYLPGDSILCVRAKRDSNIIKSNDDEAYYRANLSYFRDLVEYEPGSADDSQDAGNS